MKPICLLLLMLCLSAEGQDKMGVQTLSTGLERRKALLIGNLRYTHFRPLVNTERDVDAMAALLRKLNFQVTVYKNLDYKASVQAIATFRNALAPNDVAMVYYSGHGIGADEQTYLLPIDADIQCTNDLDAYGPLSLSKLINDLDNRQVRNSFVFLDACRNLPISTCDRSKGDEKIRGLIMPTNQPKGNLIAFATREGRTADDGNFDKMNSLFTSELLKHLATPDRDIRYIMDDVLNGVETRSGGKQRPQKLEDLGGPFMFVKTGETPIATTKPTPAPTSTCPLWRWPTSLVHLPDGRYTGRRLS